MDALNSGKDTERKRLSPTDYWNPIAECERRIDVLSDALHDFWQPDPAPSEPPSAEPSGSPPPSDFWYIGASPVASDVPPVDWGAQSALPWFDPDLSSNPFILDDAPLGRSLAERRSRWLVQLLDIPEQRRRQRLASFFHEVFAAFPLQQTFKALSDMAVSGVDADSMRNGCAFRIEFLDTPKLAARRSFRARQPAPYHDPAAMLSWKRAVRLAELCNGGELVDAIDEDWHREWLALSFGEPLYWSYLDFIEWRLFSASLGYLEPELQSYRTEWTDVRLPSLSISARRFSHAIGLRWGPTDVIGTCQESRSHFDYVRRGRGNLKAGTGLLGERNLHRSFGSRSTTS
ncbi:hypothetical protein [Devosia sp.]|uniref:hypothetical protein n=1 Tax=Devosia sp. TaxID=1871048 RepID=UPI003A931E73